MVLAASYGTPSCPPQLGKHHPQQVLHVGLTEAWGRLGEKRDAT